MDEQSLNRTLLELKLFTKNESFKIITRLNRTLLELKRLLTRAANLK